MYLISFVFKPLRGTYSMMVVNKAHGPDIISGGMIELCEDSIALPISINFNNIINTGIFSAIWKSANVIPVHKSRK